VRQQLAVLLAKGGYEVVYWQPSPFFSRWNKRKRVSFRGVEVDVISYPFIFRFNSLGLVYFLNVFLFWLANRLSSFSFHGTSILFVPHVISVFRKNSYLAFINDDFSLMAHPVFRASIRARYLRLASQAKLCFFSSRRLLNKYDSEGKVFYPWSWSEEICSDEVVLNSIPNRNRIVYWGTVGRHVNFTELEMLAETITELGLDLRVELYGAVEPTCSNVVADLEYRYSCFSYEGMCDFSEIKPETILVGLELLRKDFDFVEKIEFPNKAPRFLSRGIPVFYSGCNLVERGGFRAFGCSYDFIEKIQNKEDYSKLSLMAVKMARDESERQRMECLVEVFGS